MVENGSDKCSCKRTKCERFGKCNECIDHHRQYKRYPLPYCKRVKRSRGKTADKQI